MARTIHYNIKCNSLVIHNYSSEEKDRDIERLRAENNSLKELLLHRNTADDAASISSTDDNNRARKNECNSQISSQPFANRFPSDKNNLNNVSQNIDFDTDKTELKRTPSTNSGYDQVVPVYLDFPTLGNYQNIPQCLWKKTPKGNQHNTSKDSYKQDSARITQQDVTTRYVRMPRTNNQHPVHEQAPPLPKRKSPAYVAKKTHTEIYGSNSEATINNEADDENDTYQSIGYLNRDKKSTPNTARSDNLGNQFSSCHITYDKVVDERYLKNTDLANNFEKEEHKNVSGRILKTQLFFI
ncbi:hypothetical protein LOTGIDRAFT_231559 [Lottia gigantea]|uniref:Uncharacterized protein n=1 Tax=Lottia gigantea TaxID=225164 RepID=V4AUD9_LOTGI|nr:hypothetical protein LOTGIDRAFT_231559 [Lottia gigantea]ESO97366.1 hypothetical protein LOTGIDRAFT_231559 [Lottia gigantea]